MFGLRTLLALVVPVAVAVVILAVAGKRGAGIFKKQGVAWGLTLLMVFTAIGIGNNKADASNTPEPGSPNAPGSSQQGGPNAPSSSVSFVWDNAGVLSEQTVRTLDQRNDRLWNRCSVSVGVVTCDYGGDDLYDYAMQCAEDMGLGGYDMIVVLDIRGENYWLLQGNDIRRDFTDNDCSNYAYDYMEDYFAWGLYDNAVLDLTEALETWYGNYYG